MVRDSVCFMKWVLSVGMFVIFLGCWLGVGCRFYDCGCDFF